jgi:hypothetical protein
MTLASLLVRLRGLGPLLLLAITVCGLALIVAPSFGRQLLANTTKAISLLLLGMILLQVACASLHC